MDNIISKHGIICLDNSDKRQNNSTTVFIQPAEIATTSLNYCLTSANTYTMKQIADCFRLKAIVSVFAIAAGN